MNNTNIRCVAVIYITCLMAYFGTTSILRAELLLSDKRQKCIDTIFKVTTLIHEGRYKEAQAHIADELSGRRYWVFLGGEAKLPEEQIEKWSKENNRGMETLRSMLDRTYLAALDEANFGNLHLIESAVEVTDRYPTNYRETYGRTYVIQASIPGFEGKHCEELRFLLES